MLRLLLLPVLHVISIKIHIEGDIIHHVWRNLPKKLKHTSEEESNQNMLTGYGIVLVK